MAIYKGYPKYFKKRDKLFRGELRAQYKSLFDQALCHSSLYKRNAPHVCIILYNSLPDNFKFLQDKADQMAS